MRNASTKCVILGHKNFSEFHKLLFCYTEDFGKIKIVARGARKLKSKFTGHLETLNIGIASLYFSSHSITLTEFSNLEHVPQLSPKLENVASILQIAEITDKLVFSNQQIPDLTQLLEKTITALSLNHKTGLISIAYLTKMLHLSGLLPDFRSHNSKLETKYMKFFEFTKTAPYGEILKIRLSKEEELQILRVLLNFIENEFHTPLLTFTTPLTFSSLSTS